MQSYGDVLLSAVIHTPTEKHRTEVTLYEALRRKHGKSKSRAVQHVLRYIEEHWKTQVPLRRLNRLRISDRH
jgi:hypothetical protein